MVKSLKACYFKQGDIRPAFTMVELVFVIVILGILAAVAIPRLGASRDDAVIVKGKSQISAIRSGIALQKSKRMLEGTVPFIPTALDTIVAASVDGNRLFNFNDGNTSNILEYPIFSQSNQDGSWVKTAANTYAFRVMGIVHSFFYDANTGIFNCTAGTYCDQLTR
ncbi:prepilin-type N-terminal cleavage/methylation domain-containing protein [Sulfurospirillum arsenophilum]|uniref:prepilin-type N-terminal cleavage/methylation domain-containing protein n=1 Tax=Sulfurospirillum arsenophilum TaxID=56698 RepID=UPI0005AB175C|nr:prepilin-type N-terminal cleavage/methylation domain-containing protein [Sulfurospirillum arsenophilum]